MINTAWVKIYNTDISCNDFYMSVIQPGADWQQKYNDDDGGSGCYGTVIRRQADRVMVSCHIGIFNIHSIVSSGKLYTSADVKTTLKTFSSFSFV